MLFFLWPMLLASEVGVFLCQMVSAAFFAVSAGAVLQRLPAPSLYSFVFRASVVLGGMILFGIVIALVLAVCAISVYVGGIWEASYAPFLVLGPPGAVFVIASVFFWPMYALPVVWRWETSTSSNCFESEEDWYGYHICPGLKDSFQASIHNGNWFRYGILAMLALSAIPVSLYFSTLPLVTSTDFLRYAFIGGICLPCIHLIIVHNTYQAFKTTKPGYISDDPKSIRAAKDQFEVDHRSAITGNGGRQAFLSQVGISRSLHDRGGRTAPPDHLSEWQERGSSKDNKPWPVYDSSAEHSSIEKPFCSCDQASHWRLGRNEQHLFPETWRSMHAYPGFTVAPWTPTNEEHRIVFCSSCNRLWCVKYIGYEDAFEIKELSDSCLPIIGRRATPDKIIGYVLTEDYASGRLCLDTVLETYFSVATYPLTETADLIIFAMETADGIGPAKELLNLLRWVVLRAYHDQHRQPIAKKGGTRFGGSKEPSDRLSSKPQKDGEGSIYPKLRIYHFKSVIEILNRPTLYQKSDLLKAAHTKYEIQLVLKDIAQYGFPPKEDVLSLFPEDKRKLMDLTNPDQITERCFEALAEIPAVLNADHLRTIVESALFLYNTITSNSRSSPRDINQLIALLNRVDEVISYGEDPVGAAHQQIYQLLEKACAYQIIPDQCREEVLAILNAGTS